MIKRLTVEQIAQLIEPLVLGSSDEEIIEKSRRAILDLVKRKKISRESVFLAIQSLGLEPSAAMQTNLGLVIPGLIPKRTTVEAWDLVKRNLRLASYAAPRLGISKLSLNRSVLLDDVISELKLQMFFCALYWDKRKGAFTTYFLGSLNKTKFELLGKLGVLNIPHGYLLLAYKYKRLKEKDPNLSDELAAKILGLSPHNLEQIKRALRIYKGSLHTVDADSLLYSSPPFEMTDTGDIKRVLGIDAFLETESEFGTTPEELVLEKERREIVWASLKKLPNRDKKVLDLSFGITNRNKTQSLRQIGKQFGISGTRAGQIRSKALSRLNRKMLRPLL